jgi:hypothetical protein
MAAKKKATKKMSNAAKAWGIGGAITAATLAAAAGTYLLSSEKNKKKTKKWVKDARREVVKHAKTAKKLGKKEYDKIVDEVVKRYGPLEDLTAADVIKAGKDLKGEWDKIQAHAKTIAKAYAPKKKAVSKKKPVRTKTKAKKARA